MIGILIMGFIAFILSVILVNLEVRMNAKKKKILSLLPGYNCGTCGFGGCSDMADAIIDDP